ncbi:transcription factor FER-LIKE IRON DEFICIENCY-INDUCED TRANSCRIPTION FACTOR [Cornus florida]|uniref:transcription factor FER-LIKE IRON DEFICIENCY-INDUCED TRANSCRIPTION FACTOR n=1 Tax=Cornus florida TaxID=4283 RepID=UPI0028A05A6C|nr:transcription factor FER-LIKE IRON DEFICIENCY-INDUCED TRANSCRIPTION FACTOR [Cornus florida]
METRDSSLGHVGDLSLFHDLMDETNFKQFVDFIRGESAEPIVKFCPNYDCAHISGCLEDDQLFGPTLGDVFDFSPAAAMSNPNSVMNSLAGVDEEMKGAEEENDEEDSSATTTTTTTPTKRTTKVDRSRTLISERRRRGRMKEKLYALRALVPNITKMDKASIVGDAVLYVQELQVQAKKLRAEIAGLESSLAQTEGYQGGLFENPKKNQVTNMNNHHTVKNIKQMDMFQVEEREFYVRLACNKGQGVVVSLYRTLESLTCFNVQSSNLATNTESFVLTFTLNVRECEMVINLPNLKLWVTGALVKQGFRFETQSCA